MIRVSKAPLVLRSYHILLLQINLHINIWYRAGASHPFGTLIITIGIVHFRMPGSKN